LGSVRSTLALQQRWSWLWFPLTSWGDGQLKSSAIFVKASIIYHISYSVYIYTYICINI
jgi:hypothetical protein